MNRKRKNWKALRQKQKQDKLKVRNYTLYALKLTDEKYYIGLTSYKNVNVRYNQHLDGSGAKWTKLYKPTEIIETRKIGHIPEKDALILETKLTVEYIEKYGIENVRGGEMCYLNLERCKFLFNTHSAVTIKAWK